MYIYFRNHHYSPLDPADGIIGLPKVKQIFSYNMICDGYSMDVYCFYVYVSNFIMVYISVI